MTGLFETARELICAENAIGHEAWCVDPTKDSVPKDDRVEYRESVNGADVIVDHSGMTKAILATDIPIVHIRHGRPRSTFLLDSRKVIPGVYTHCRNIGRSERYQAICTFWPEHVAHWELLTGRKVHTLPPPVDLQRWSDKGPAGYKFGGKKGDFNVVVADAWRDDIDPLEAIVTLGSIEGVTLHIYAATSAGALRPLLDAIRAKGRLGEVKSRISGLDNVYRAADVVVVPHKIATRSLREAMACGAPVIAAPGNKYSTAVSSMDSVSEMEQALSKARGDKLSRRQAEKWFEPRTTACTLLNVIRETAGALV